MSTGVSSPKYTVPLTDIPQTITVVPQEVIQQRGATTLREVLRNVPGISIQAGEGGVPNGDNLSVRGFQCTQRHVRGRRARLRRLLARPVQSRIRGSGQRPVVLDRRTRLNWRLGEPRQQITEGGIVLRRHIWSRHGRIQTGDD